MTNLPANLFCIDEIGKLYQRRWEIESSFKDLTHTLKMCQWHTSKTNGILQEIYALLWFVNTVKIQCRQLAITTKQWLGNVYFKPNFKLCATLLMDNIDLLVKHRTAQLQSLLTFWIKRTTEKRVHLSRSYPRVVKKHGKRYINASMVAARLTERH